MEPKVFGAGTVPGSPTTSNEVKTLICFLLTKITEGLLFEEIHETLQEGRLVNYFELVQNIDQLEASGHTIMIKEKNANRYKITELGIKTAKELESSLQASVRTRALATAKTVIARQKRLQEVKIDIVQTEGGYQVNISIPDAGMDLLALSVFAPNKEEADILRRRFLNNPIFIYKGIMALLQGDKAILGDLLPNTEKLF